MTDNQKVLYIIAGANGSGKTTFAKSFADIDKLYFINADEIAKSFDSDNIDKYKILAGKQFFKELNESLTVDSSFVIETTLSGKYLVKIINKAKQRNFKIVIIYLFLETESEHVFRVANRVFNGGHDIPEQDIVRRYKRSKSLFWNLYKEMADEWMLFFNGDDDFQYVANQNEVLNPYLFDVFLNGVKHE